jgi:anti-anti-sigma regulatory factor
MTLKIQRSADDGFVLFTLSGRIQAEHLEQLQQLFEFETADHNIALDLKELRLVDRDAVRFLAGCEADGTRLNNCPAYIREWIAKEQNTEQPPIVKFATGHNR